MYKTTTIIIFSIFMKPVLLSLCCLLSLKCWSQDHPLEKTLWNIRSLNQNGAILLQKIKYSATPGSKKDYVAFNDNNRFASNIISIPDCQMSESGSYSLTSPNTLQISGIDAAVNQECKNFYSLSGRYKFSVNEDLLVLRALQEEDTDDEDVVSDSYDEDDDEAVDAAEAADDEYTEDVAVPVDKAALPASYEMGFAQVTSNIISPAEAAILQQYILTIYAICSTEIAIQNIGNNSMEDYSEDYLKSYTSHIVWNNEARIQNNIVILFDETNARSWIYTGTHNGRFITTTETTQWKAVLNSRIKQGKIFEGLQEVLQQAEKTSHAQCTKIQTGK